MFKNGGVVIQEPEPSYCPGQPREDYERRYHVWRVGATPQRIAEIKTLAGTDTSGPSYDDAMFGNLTDKTAYLYDIPPVDRPAFITFRGTYYNDPPAKIVFVGGDDPLPPDPPDPDWTPRNYVPSGTKQGFHCIGGEPVDMAADLAAHGVHLSSIKLVAAIGGIRTSQETWTIARMIDYNGHNVEGFDPNGNPEAQAEARLAALRPAYEPYFGMLDFIEIVNEQNSPEWNTTHCQNFARFFIRAMDILESGAWPGVRLAWPSASLGTPEPWQWNAMSETSVFERAAAGGHALALHEYGTALHGPNSIICRYRDVYNRIILPRHLNIPLFITEYNVNHELLGTDLLAEWAAYDGLVRQDSYVAGVEIFTLGMGWPWYVTPTAATLKRFAAYAIAEKDKTNG